MVIKMGGLIQKLPDQPYFSIAEVMKLTNLGRFRIENAFEGKMEKIGDSGHAMIRYADVKAFLEIAETQSESKKKVGDNGDAHADKQ
jgi:hypothetical protein